MINRRVFVADSALAMLASSIVHADQASELHRGCGVFDAYTKPVLKFTRTGIEPGRFIERDEALQAGLWRLRDGGVRMANMSVGVPRYSRPASADGKSPTCCVVAFPRRRFARS